MSRFISGAFATLTAITLISVDSFAGDCSFLSRDPLTLRDTELFFKLSQATQWKSLDETSADGTWGNQKISFAYVIQETLEPRRSGVLVVKSGRDRTPADPAPRVIQLVRDRPDNNADATPFDNGVCGPIPDFGSATVSAASYDRYHDLGGRVSESDQSTLDRFHYKFLGRSNRCRRTNDSTPDSRIPLVNRSNLGQFSFDQTVVGSTTNSQIVALASPTAAYAGVSDKLAEQRVEMKAYRVM